MSLTQREISRFRKLLMWALVGLPYWTISALSAQDLPASTAAKGSRG